MINSDTRLYCIFGKPVNHSLSPLMHNAAFNANKINAVYLAFAPLHIGSAIESIKTLNICGASITIPFKVDVIPYLDQLDDLSAKIGAVNTITYSNGTLSGFNTDGIGAVRALRNAGFVSMGSSALIIGNGGSARAIAYTLLSEGASVTIAGRNMINANALAADLKTHYKNASAVNLENVTKPFLANIDCIINTTPVGMEPDSPRSPIPDGLFIEKHYVFDIVYKPEMTSFLKQGLAARSTIVKGIDMLLYQGARQFEIWTGLDAPLTVMRDALQKAAGQQT